MELINKCEKELESMQKKKIDKRKLIVFGEYLFMLISSAVLGYFIAFALDFDAYSIKYAAISSVLVGLLLARPALRRRNVLTSVQFVHFALVVFSMFIIGIIIK